MHRRLACATATAALACLSLPAGAGAAGEGSKAAETRLIEAYTPVLMLREQEDPPCDTDAEQYEATTVDTVLGNPAVELTEADKDGDETTLKRGPTTADVAKLGDGYHLNIPGDPLGDTCEYARDFAKLGREGKAPAVTYASRRLSTPSKRREVSAANSSSRWSVQLSLIASILSP